MGKVTACEPWEVPKLANYGKWFSVLERLALGIRTMRRAQVVATKQHLFGSVQYFAG